MRDRPARGIGDDGVQLDRTTAQDEVDPRAALAITEHELRSMAVAAGAVHRGTIPGCGRGHLELARRQAIDLVLAGRVRSRTPRLGEQLVGAHASPGDRCSTLVARRPGDRTAAERPRAVPVSCPRRRRLRGSGRGAPTMRAHRDRGNEHSNQRRNDPLQSPRSWPHRLIFDGVQAPHKGQSRASTDTCWQPADRSGCRSTTPAFPRAWRHPCENASVIAGSTPCDLEPLIEPIEAAAV